MNKYTLIHVRTSDKTTLSIRYKVIYTLEFIWTTCSWYERALDYYPFGHISAASC